VAITLGSGKPFSATIINTEPKQLRFGQKFDELYKIRYYYVPRPASIDSLTQELYLPDQFHEGLYYKWVSMVAADMGEERLALRWEAMYERWLKRNKPLAASDHLEKQSVKFSHFA